MKNDVKEPNREFEFQCLNKKCGFKGKVTTKEIKLLRTDVINDSNVIVLSWVIYTCHKCGESYTVTDRKIFLYELAPTIRIKQPKIEGIK